MSNTWTINGWTNIQSECGNEFCDVEFWRGESTIKAIWYSIRSNK